MTSLKVIVEKLGLDAVSSHHGIERPVVAGYAADLLSCTMKNAKKDYLWVTLQSHLNVVAVASLLNLAGVIITEGNRPDSETITRAEKEGVALFMTPKTTFTVVGELTLLGIRGESSSPH